MFLCIFCGVGKKHTGNFVQPVSLIIINLQSEKETLNHAVFAVPQLLRSEVIAFSRFVLYIDLNRSGKSSYQSICVLLYFSHALLCKELNFTKSLQRNVHSLVYLFALSRNLSLFTSVYNNSRQ